MFVLSYTITIPVRRIIHRCIFYHLYYYQHFINNGIGNKSLFNSVNYILLKNLNRCQPNRIYFFSWNNITNKINKTQDEVMSTFFKFEYHLQTAFSKLKFG